MGLIGLNFYWRPWGLILQAVAVVHFVRRRPEAYWLWIILIGGGLGAMAYIIAEVLPDAALLQGSLAGFSRRRRIGDLEALILVNPAIGNREELADLYLDEGKYKQARQLYDQVIQAQPDELDPHYRRGLAALSMSDAAAALPDLEKVVMRDPKYDLHRAMGLLAQAHSLAGQPERADQLFQAAIAFSTLSETVNLTTLRFWRVGTARPRLASGRSVFWTRNRRCPGTCAGGSVPGSGRPRRCSIKKRLEGWEAGRV